MRTIKMNHAQMRAWRENHGDSRDKIRAELLAKNDGNTFRIQSPNGRMMGTVRGEKNITGAVPLGIQNGAPSPELCVCQSYAGTPKGEHHPVCQFRVAWEQSKGIRINEIRSQVNAVTHMPVDRPLGPPSMVQHFAPPIQAGAGVPIVATPLQPAIIAMMSPEQCECRKFTKPSGADPNQHHFICEHYDRWKTAHPTEASKEVEQHDTEPPKVFVLVDLNTKEVLRDATSEEVEQSQGEEAKSGAPLITIDDATFAVVPREIQERA